MIERNRLALGVNKLLHAFIDSTSICAFCDVGVDCILYANSTQNCDMKNFWKVLSAGLPCAVQPFYRATYAASDFINKDLK